VLAQLGEESVRPSLFPLSPLSPSPLAPRPWPSPDLELTPPLAPPHRLLITTNGRPVPPSGPPTLALSALLAAARVAMPPDRGGDGESELEIEDVEGMCVSLMEQVRRPALPPSFLLSLSFLPLALSLSPFSLPLSTSLPPLLSSPSAN